MTVDELEQRMTVEELIDHAADFRLLKAERDEAAQHARNGRL